MTAQSECDITCCHIYAA